MSLLTLKRLPSVYRCIPLMNRFISSVKNTPSILNIDEENEIDYLSLQSTLHANGINWDTYWFVKKNFNFSETKKNYKNTKDIDYTYTGFLL